jgi:hypothetical protein
MRKELRVGLMAMLMAGAVAIPASAGSTPNLALSGSAGWVKDAQGSTIVDFHTGVAAPSVGKNFGAFAPCADITNGNGPATCSIEYHGPGSYSQAASTTCTFTLATTGTALLNEMIPNVGTRTIALSGISLSASPYQPLPESGDTWGLTLTLSGTALAPAPIAGQAYSAALTGEIVSPGTNCGFNGNPGQTWSFAADGNYTLG